MYNPTFYNVSGEEQEDKGVEAMQEEELLGAYQLKTEVDLNQHLLEEDHLLEENLHLLEEDQILSLLRTLYQTGKITIIYNIVR